ncbi:hypothetical protein FDUTEX481_09851 [Tolypothrix sp. PCC 7601]|nr:hypothetical protein FDUTEX481_09851 [Tolypothrix sp. PCC 7601]
MIINLSFPKLPSYFTEKVTLIAVIQFWILDFGFWIWDFGLTRRLNMLAL